MELRDSGTHTADLVVIDPRKGPKMSGIPSGQVGKVRLPTFQFASFFRPNRTGQRAKGPIHGSFDLIDRRETGHSLSSGLHIRKLLYN